jgi:hypothetical protein
MEAGFRHIAASHPSNAGNQDIPRTHDPDELGDD